jgi:hypothetical protein
VRDPELVGGPEMGSLRDKVRSVVLKFPFPGAASYAVGVVKRTQVVAPVELMWTAYLTPFPSQPM